MSAHKRLTTWQKATALIPLALLSGAWTTSLTMTSPVSAEQKPVKLPDGTVLPAKAISAPASVSSPGEIAPGVPVGSARTVVAESSANGIPDAALAAYQRAAQVIDNADKGCHMDWTLIGAIGRVESNHGRYGGNTLDDNGVSRPGIYGIPLDGSHGTTKVTDTDGGRYDKDPQYDRAVGPLQFIPATWSVVGVDGDGDGRRDPQDIDDAALATAVYLCSGDEDLSTTRGQRSAVYRYNHSQAYVNLVLSIMRAYASGDYSAVPTGVAGVTTLTPDFAALSKARASAAKAHKKPEKKHRAATGGSAGGGSGSSGGAGVGSGGSTGSGGGGTPSVPARTKAPAPKPAAPAAPKPVKKVVKKVTDGAAKTAPKPGGAVQDTMTRAEAKAKCLAKDPLHLDACIADLMK